jgi:hypothetical protein
VSDRAAFEGMPSPADAYDIGRCDGEAKAKVALRANVRNAEAIEKLAGALPHLEKFDVDSADAREAVLGAITRLAGAIG